MATRMVMMELYAHNEREGTCPFGLLYESDYGDGVSVLRCHKPYKHMGPHETTTSGPVAADTPTIVQIRVQWLPSETTDSTGFWKAVDEHKPPPHDWGEWVRRKHCSHHAATDPPLGFSELRHAHPDDGVEVGACW
jgi:hypothetical protein